VDKSGIGFFNAGSFSTAGTGSAGSFVNTNAANTSASMIATTNGTGSAANFSVVNPANSSNAVAAFSNGTGPSFYSENTGTGRAASFKVNNASNTRAALFAETTGTGPSGYFFNGNQIGPQLSGPSALIAETQSATGPAARFYVNSSSNGSAALEAITISSTGPALYALSSFSNNIAIFQYGNSSPVNVARIDKTGKGFFNGGTQASGADVAEMFDVEGTKSEYEPGDVLVISESTDRTVEKSSEANSTKVVGVYATKPGVTLTEKGIEENLDQLVPMGVIGVIPTKVCIENGPIKRGDLLVTSSKKGHAMKAIPVVFNGVSIYPTGAVLGKALENFDGTESGVIKVLVNVK
jgi:trimeric autotransporter adhesin